MRRTSIAPSLHIDRLAAGFYPRLLLLTPHIALISIILSTYPYPDKPSADPLKIPEQAEAGAPVTEGSVPWQANITGIQNLMGSVYAEIISLPQLLLTLILAPTYTTSFSHTYTIYVSPQPI